MKDIISKIIDKISIAKVLIAAGIVVTATTIALAIKALKKRLAAKKAKPVAPVQAIKLSELDEVTFEDTEEEPEDNIIDFEESEDELEESNIVQDDIEISTVMVEEADPIEMGFGAIPFTNDASKMDISSQNNEQEFDDEWYKKTLADLLNDESFLEPEEEYEDPFAPKLSPEEKKKAEFAIEQCEKMSDKLHEKIRKLGSDCPSEYHRLSKQIVLAKMRIYDYYYGFD